MSLWIYTLRIHSYEPVFTQHVSGGMYEHGKVDIVHIGIQKAFEQIGTVLLIKKLLDFAKPWLVSISVLELFIIYRNVNT